MSDIKRATSTQSEKALCDEVLFLSYPNSNDLMIFGAVKETDKIELADEMEEEEKSDRIFESEVKSSEELQKLHRILAKKRVSIFMNVKNFTSTRVLILDALVLILALLIAFICIILMRRTHFPTQSIYNSQETDTNPGTRTGGVDTSVKVRETEDIVSYPEPTAVQENYPDYPIDWKDAVLEKRIRNIIGIYERDIYHSDVRDIRVLDLSTESENDSQDYISDISALSEFSGLTHLNLSNNTISDISVIGELTNLTALNLSYNWISDLTPNDKSVFDNLTNLRELWLSYNTISDIRALSKLTSLKELRLSYNAISDISVLEDLENLRTLYLSGNSIRDIRVLSRLSNLEQLWLYQNTISDINALSGLSKLKKLDLSNNMISDINALSGLINLTELWLSTNYISDIKPLGGLKNLTILSLTGNQIADYSPVEKLKIKELYK